MTLNGNCAVDECAVINASPLILLSRSGHVDLLSHFARQVLVPEQVAAEILVRGVGDPTVRAIRTRTWLRVVPVERIPTSVLEWGLGPGESAVLALALATPNAVAVIDDLLGRKCAGAHGVPLRGTIGIVLAAKEKGHIPAVRPVIEDLLGSGLYLSRNIVDYVLRLAGER